MMTTGHGGCPRIFTRAPSLPGWRTLARSAQGHLAQGTGTFVPVGLARRQLAELAQERVARLGRSNPDAHVHDVHAVRPGDDRVQVEFGDLRHIVGQP